MQATGTFEVKLNPLAAYNTTPGAKLGRMSIDKQFHGDLEATSQGEMLSAMTEVKGSAGHVAIEHVSGTLHGRPLSAIHGLRGTWAPARRTGRFVPQHNATMARGAPYLNIIVVPDSGSGELAGLRGAMRIIIADGKHSYEFDYALDGAG